MNQKKKNRVNSIRGRPPSRQVKMMNESELPKRRQMKFIFKFLFIKTNTFITKDLSTIFFENIIVGMFFKKSARVSINQCILKEKEFNFYDKFWILVEIFFILRYQKGLSQLYSKKKMLKSLVLNNSFVKMSVS